MLKSINLPQGLLQANVVERIQQTQQQSPDMQQRYFELTLAKEQKKAEERVRDSQKAENVIIREENSSREGKRSFSDDDERDSPQGEGSEKRGRDGEMGNMINVRA